MNWPRRSSVPEIAADEAHVWSADLTGRWQSDLPLSPDELERAARLSQPIHRDRYVAARAALREVLGLYTQRPSESLRFEYGSAGKPALELMQGAAGLYFNLTHADNLALIAVTGVGDIGVDVERVREVEDLDDVAQRFFSPRERAAIQALSRELRSGAFLRCWTRKEAYIKATGEGLRCPLDSFDVELAYNLPARIIRIDGDDRAAAEWSLVHLEPSREFVGAMAIKSTRVRTRCFHLARGETNARSV